MKGSAASVAGPFLVWEDVRLHETQMTADPDLSEVDGGGAVALLEDVDLVDDTDPVWRRLVAEAVDPAAADD